MFDESSHFNHRSRPCFVTVRGSVWMFTEDAGITTIEWSASRNIVYIGLVICQERFDGFLKVLVNGHCGLIHTDAILGTFW